jgi:hypothetical protein
LSEYGIFSRKEVAMGKYVSEAFQGKARNGLEGTQSWSGDVVESLMPRIARSALAQGRPASPAKQSVARFAQRTIGALIREVLRNVLKEDVAPSHAGVISALLAANPARPYSRACQEWYKQQLASRALRRT